MRRATLSGALASCWLAATPLRAAEPAGKVDALRGEAFAQAAATRRNLVVAADVFIGDLVATAANSALALRLGVTLVKLGADTRLRIDRYLAEAGGVLELVQGPMIFDRNDAAPKSDLTVRSPFGLIAVRGTRFFAGPSNAVFGVFVFRGRVTVVGRSTAVQLGEGLGTDIAAPGGEPSDPHTWGAPRVRAAEASVSLG